MAIAENLNSPAGDPKTIVTLVHGTFAPQAAWSNEESAMRKDLRTALGSDVCIRASNWTGANSIFGRVEAAKALITDFKDVKARHPHARHYVVAHSHGGTVSLFAHENCPEYARPSGIACISTPFFHARVRDLSTLDGITLTNGFFGLLLGLTWLTFVICGISVFWLIFSVVPCLLLAWVAGFILAGGIQAWSNQAQQLSDNISVTAAPDSNLFIVRVAGDEVSFALGAAQLFSWAASRAYSKLSLLQGSKMFRSVRLPKVVWFLFAASAAMTIFAAAIEGPMQSPSRGWLTLLAQGLLTLSCFAWLAVKTNWLDRIVFGASLLCLAGATSLTKVWLGTSLPGELEAGGPVQRWLRGLIIALLVEVSTEYCPEGPWTVTQLSRLPADLETSETLVHSAYQDPRVRALVVAWLQHSESDLNFSQPVV